MGLLTDVSVAASLAGRALGRRLAAEGTAAPDTEAFTREMSALLARAGPEVVLEHAWLDLPAQQPPWVPSGLSAQAGEQFSYFAEGRTWASRLLDVYVEPALQLWCKVGQDGEVFRGTRSSHTFEADRSGPVQFGNYFPNTWADRQGRRVQDDACYRQVSGAIKVLLIRWPGSAGEGLRKLSALGDPGGRLAAELARLEAGDTAPPGWHYLWHLGPADIYRQQPLPDGQQCIHCHTHGDVGILQKEVDLPLDESTEIRWRWRVNQLPSALREDSVPSHDYLSLAVEFDNGRDITWYWSSALAAGTGYDCPLPNWKGKEFHVVVRSGIEGLGQWHWEERNIHRDYRHYMGEPPARVVRVWLIANSIFQRSTGSCDYRDILLRHRDGEVRLL